ncbi:RNA polymerase sigma factor [Candidatus Viridilinea mediisalina]|uniref:Uncharacterized protein n=1 Tax=Candidatus Viridilinea mediisalina TaxID=2024553 RepID=A0A2A6RDJ2_9CHLR|nr:sigma-70 family RNA polymerase sigma factor [Candidatus Viridilinea mediisalina]PDV98959.1 hypothetical protein CJ255_21765 [Candidatus Viridilinea mediisalina]
MPHADQADLGSLPLEMLQARCEAQLATFRRSRDQHQDSSSCEEILRRAAAQDAYAFDYLWSLTIPLVRTYSPAACRLILDDLQQEAALRLWRRFQHATIPFQAASFAAYRNYVRTTVVHVCQHLQRERHYASLAYVAEPLDPSSFVGELLRYALYERCLALLPDALHRAVFYRRFVLGEDSATIAAALAQQFPDLTKQRVSRVVEACPKRLAAIPEIREMLESDGGDDL